MDWSKGFSARYIMTIVDPVTWADKEEMRFVSGSIDKDADSALVESASIQTTEPINGEAWIRIYLEAEQSGSRTRTAIFTGITSTPGRKMNGHHEKYDMDCYSVLKQSADVLLPIGYYCPAGSGANKVKELLSVGFAPVEVVGVSPAITEPLVAEFGETNLSMARKILDAIDWKIVIRGNGTAVICEKSNEVALNIGTNSNDMIENEVDDTFDWYSCPNCYMAVSSEFGTAAARDDDPESRLSTVNRGREVWVYDKDVKLSNNETVTEYARRKLKEAQAPHRNLSYRRRFYEGVYPGDVISINYPEYNLSGNFKILSQTYDIGYGCSVNEEVESVE